MNDENSIKRFEELTARASEIPITGNSKEPTFTKWRSDCIIAISRIFGDDSRNLSLFENVKFHPSSYNSNSADAAFKKSQQSGIGQAKALLMSFIDEIINYGLSETEEIPHPASALSLVENICRKFHRVARQLRSRHGSRPTLEVTDEYDVQDLLHALLKLHFDDVRSEEYSPSYAGGGSRIDFLLIDHGIVIEVKNTRSNLRDKQIGAELIIDINRYEKHPSCKILLCFVYDPEGFVGNPTGLANDLERHAGSLPVRVLICPRD